VLATWPSLRITDGPPMLRSENARLSGWVYVDIRGRDLRSAVQDMQRVVAEKVVLPPGYSVSSWSGQFEFLERATAPQGGGAVHAADHLRAALPDLPRFDEALLIMATLPFALVGGIWLLWAARLQPVGGRRGRLHRAGRGGGRVRRHHAAVPASRPGTSVASGQDDARTTCSTRSATARYCACDPRR
jgi:hypothetical protein